MRKIIGRADIKNFIVKYWDGLTVEQIAQETGFSATAIRNHLIKQGVVMRPQGTRISKAT